MTQALAEAPNVTADGADKQTLQVISIEKIDESKTNPRRTFDPKEMEKLEASIREKGILFPALVRPKGSGRYELVAGARRYRVAKKIGLFQVPCLIRELTDEQAIEAQVIENLQRTDVHPLEEAEAYKALIGKGRYTADELAAKIGKAASYVYSRLQLCSLTAPVRKAFLEERITVSHAERIAKLQPQTQPQALQVCFEYGSSGLRPVKQLDRWINDNVFLTLSKAGWDLDDAKLVPAAGPCSTCPRRAGASPGLFPELAKDTCTDPVCFKAKRVALVDRKVNQARSANKNAIAISTEWSSPRGSGAIGTSSYKVLAGKSPKTCAATKVGILIDGDQPGAARTICAPKSGATCKVHSLSNHDYTPKPPSAAEKARQKKERFETKVGRELRRELLRKIEAASTKVPTGEKLRHLLQQVFEHVKHSKRRHFAEWKGWKENEKDWEFDYSKVFAKKTAGMKDPELWSVFPLLILADHIEFDWDDAIASWARGCGVDMKKLRAETVKRLQPKKAAPTKK